MRRNSRRSASMILICYGHLVFDREANPVTGLADMDEALAWGRKAVIACRTPVEVREFGIPT